MRKRRLIIIIVIIVLVALLIYLNLTNPFEVNKNPQEDILASNSNGTVYKKVCGNLSSNDTAVLILGVHNLENGTHDATNETILELTENNSLSKKYIVYFIRINWNAEGLNTSEYQVNRHMGELLAHDYIVNDVKQYNPYIVVDVHEMEEYYENDRFLLMVDENNVTEKYCNQLAEATNLPEYNFSQGTSPQWVTIPIAQQGIHTLIFEYAQAESYSNKVDMAHKLVEGIDSLNPKLS